MATIHDRSKAPPRDLVNHATRSTVDAEACAPTLFFDQRAEPLVEFPDRAMSRHRGAAEVVLHRYFDVLLAATFIVVLSPLFIVTTLLVWVSGPGSLVFRHDRIGAGGRHFACLKFRTMSEGAEARLADLLACDERLRSEWLADHKIRRDPRVTPIGQFLRRFSLDELPQLFNVLRGDMSIVGPRPIVAAEVAHYAEDFCHYCAVRPGLTGLWQVSGRNRLTYERRVELDCEYVRTRSIRGDLLILMRTLPAVVSGSGV